MAPKPNGGRRMTGKKNDDTRKAPVEGTALHRKETCVTALKLMGDRATAAYNELIACDVDGVQSHYHQHMNDSKKLAGLLTRLCAKHQISYTHNHYQLNHPGSKTDPSTPKASSQTADGPRLALDPDQWSCAVRAAPTKDPDGTSYLPGISLHDITEGDKLLEQILGRGNRPNVALAIAILGPPNPTYVGHAMALPLLKRGARAHKPAPVHLEGTLYQLGAIPHEAKCTQNTVRVRINPEHSVVWVRLQLHEKEAIASTPALHEAFTEQFSGKAPVNGGHAPRPTPRARARARRNPVPPRRASCQRRTPSGSSSTTTCMTSSRRSSTITSRRSRFWSPANSSRAGAAGLASAP